LYNSLIKRFNEEYTIILNYYSTEQQIELTEHLIQAIEYVRQYQRSHDEQDWGKYANHEKALLKKYGNHLKYYIDARFYEYFDFDLVLSTKDILTSEAFNVMQDAKEQSLSAIEASLFLNTVQRYLSNSLQLLYLNCPPENDKLRTVNVYDTFSRIDEVDKNITKARQLLAIHYFLKASLGIEARDNHAASGIAKLIHLLTGTRFTTLQNSDIYKKYLQMPNYKSDGKLIEDLQFIRPYFTEIGLQSALKMIDEEMNRAMKELPYHQRKKYREML
jgi:sulfur relay (sulfurtransferase) DsrC/TusE family protein